MLALAFLLSGCFQAAPRGTPMVLCNSSMDCAQAGYPGSACVAGTCTGTNVDASGRVDRRPPDQPGCFDPEIDAPVRSPDQRRADTVPAPRPDTTPPPDRTISADTGSPVDAGSLQQ